MDILKARQKAKEQKQKAAEERAQEAALREDIERARERVAPVNEDARAEPLAATVVTAEPNMRGRASTPPLRVDPLQEFLAAYDEGVEIEEQQATPEIVDDLEPAIDDERRFLTFDLEGEAYAASIMDIREILKVVTLTEVPRAPREVLGVLSKRGVVMPVADLAGILGLRSSVRGLDREQRVLVAGDGERVCGLRVDRVRQVVRLAQRAIEDVPPSLGSKNAHMLIGLGRARIEGHENPQMFILLDVPSVLAHFAETMGIAPAVTSGRENR